MSCGTIIAKRRSCFPKGEDTADLDGGHGVGTGCELLGDSSCCPELVGDRLKATDGGLERTTISLDTSRFLAIRDVLAFATATGDLQKGGGASHFPPSLAFPAGTKGLAVADGAPASFCFAKHLSAVWPTLLQ